MIVALLTLMVLTSSIHASVDIVYKITDAYDLIWNDRGSGGTYDVSIWKVRNYQNDFCSIGDVAVNNYNAPISKAVLVKANKAGAVARPASFSLVWADHGSGADRDVSVYRMNAPSGYTCLGGVAVGRYNSNPDASKYCCVKNEYVVGADTVLEYKDVGTGADRDLSLWSTIRKGGETYGIDGGNFVPVSGYSQPNSAHLLKESEEVKDIWSVPPGEVKPLSLYEMNQLKRIWYDRGSGADADCSIWRSEIKPDYYPVGDVVVATHSKPHIGFLLRPSDKKGDAVRPPVSYNLIWTDAGSGADQDVRLWNPVCSAGFVALGGVATNGPVPSIGDIYCVNSKYTTYGSSNNWRGTWADHGSGANRDVTIYEAIASGSSQQSVRGFGAVANYHARPRSPYMLNSKYVTYHAEKPIEKIYVYNVNYKLDGESRQTEPVRLYRTEVINPSAGPSTTKRTISFSVTESKSFTFSQSITIGISMEITAGSPLIGIEQKTTISASTTSTFESGSTTENTHTDTIEAEISLPAKTKSTAIIQGTKLKADVPFTATIKKFYYDGTTAYGQISGVYKGVAISDFKVTYGVYEKIP